METRDRRDSKHKVGVYTDSPKTGVAEKTSTSTQKRQSAGRREIKQGNKATGPGHRNVGVGGNKAGLKIFNFGSSSGLGAEPKEGQTGPTTFNKGLGALVGSPVFRFGSLAVVEDHGESTGKVGDILQRENYPNWGHNDQHDQEGSNGSYGVVRMGVDASLEEPFPSNRSESQNRLPSHYGRSMELDTKSMVEVSNGQTRAPHQHINSI